MKCNFQSGFALPSVLLINLLVTTMLLSLLTIISFTNKSTNKLLEKKKLELACFSAVQLTLNDSTMLYADNTVINVNDIDVEIESKQLGFFRSLTASASGVNDSIRIRYVLGIKGSVNGYFSNAVVLSRLNLRATVAGNTQINGDILGTSDKLVIGNIFGEPPTNKDFHKGIVKIDNNINQQPISDSLFESITNRYNNYAPLNYEEQNEITAENLEYFDPENVHQFAQDIKITGTIKSKNNTPVILIVQGKVEFSEESYIKKHLELLSDSSVLIRRKSHLENVIIYSNGPIIIEADSYFKNVQFFSTDRIFIQKSQFDYPSLICLNVDDTDSAKQDNAIVLDNTIVNGSVIMMTKTAGLSSNKTKIQIDKESKVQGLVYSENNLELAGEITGTVFTYNFWHYKEPTEYINWLINVKINRNELDEWYLLPIVFNDQGKIQILKEEWIY